MLDKLDSLKDRYKNLEEQMSDPEVITDMERYAKISKEYKDLKKIVVVYDAFKELMGNIKTAREMAKEDDLEMKEMAKMELDELLPQQGEFEDKLKFLIIPKDPEDERDVIFEIRSGAGGDEAAIFAGDLFRMYNKYFSTKGWKTEVVSENENAAGGYSKLVIEITGEDVYGTLKFESGAHRVQRIPQTESQGRVHTSAATVVVMPKLIMEDVNINKADLRTDTFRASGAGGQHVNKTESGVRFTHIPTGAVAESTDARSQIKNRVIALQRLYQKMYDSQRIAYENEVASSRKSLIGSGDRSDKIRTYNYPQNRVTDHRLTGDSKNFSLQTIIAGDIGGIIEELQLFENTEKLKEMDVD
ncbi:MAG: peptide chain release factor 1 [Paraglaciecola sp.]|jgi:peptide chain release factor 1